MRKENKPFLNTDWLNRKLKRESIQPYIEQVTNRLPAQIQATQEVSLAVQGTPMEGLPFVIALLKAKLLSDQQISQELRIPVRAVRKYSQTPGFNHVLQSLMPAVWSDMQLTAFATLQYHMIEKGDKEVAKWVLEHTGGVLSHQPLTVNQHHHQTLNIHGKQEPGIKGLLPAENTPISAEGLANALFKRMTDNTIKTAEPPKINISIDEDAEIPPITQQ